MEHETVVCDHHGEREATFVCQHLLEGSQRGWITIDSGDAERPDAICTACNTAWGEADDEWTEEVAAQVQVRVVCAGPFGSSPPGHGNPLHRARLLAQSGSER